jgi:HEPN superfamily RiboL-PSP-like protein
MFSLLTSQLSSELQTVQKVLSINEALRDLLITQHDSLSKLPVDLPAEADDSLKTAHALSRLIPEAPSKLDWQVYDHCAALTRIYAAYERFVVDLVAEYVLLLPKLYSKYSDLPPSITRQHRQGIGHILLNIGQKGRYRKLEAQVIAGELATGLSGAPTYTLLTEAFFIDRQNLRLDTLVRLFATLGFKYCGKYIGTHTSIIDFLKKERPEHSSAEKELHDFIEYRNEAAHKKVENLLSRDAMGAIARFIGALGIALADMVEEGILQRRMELGHYSAVLTISETHYNDHVVIGIPGQGVDLKVDDDIIIFARNVCCKAVLQSIQLDGQAVNQVTGDGAIEVGVRLDKGATIPGELRRLKVPDEAPKEIQLELQEELPAMAETADTDLADVREQETSSGGDLDDQPGTQ